MKKIFKERKTAVLGFLILFFAFVIRLYHLTILPVFADEAIYIRWSQVMGAEPTLRFLPLSDGKQPLFMWVLMFIVRRFSDPLFISRLLSVFCGLGMMVGIFGVSYLLFRSKRVSLFSGVIWAVSPFAFFFDRMALVDSMLAMFGVWTLFFAILTARLKRLDMAMLTGFMLGFALLTKSPAIFFVILLPITWILNGWKRNKKFVFTELLRLGLLAIVTLVIGYGMYNILRLGPNFNLITSRNEDYIFPLSHAWTNFKDPFIFHVKEVFSDWMVRMGPWPLLVLSLVSVLGTSWRKYGKEKLLLLTWFLVPILIQSEYAKVFTVRYILFTLPPFFILSALGILTKLKKLQVVYCGLFVLFIVTALYFDFKLVTKPEMANLPSSERSGYLEEWTAGIGISEVAEYIKKAQMENPQKQFVVGTEGYFGTLPDGLQIYLNNYPKIVVIGTGLDFRDVPQSLKDSKKAGNKTYLVVNSSRFAYKGDPTNIGLKLIASYPKAVRRETLSREYIKNGPQESLLFFEVTSATISK